MMLLRFKTVTFLMNGCCCCSYGSPTPTPSRTTRLMVLMDAHSGSFADDRRRVCLCPVPPQPY